MTCLSGAGARQRWERGGVLGEASGLGVGEIFEEAGSRVSAGELGKVAVVLGTWRSPEAWGGWGGGGGESGRAWTPGRWRENVLRFI